MNQKTNHKSKKDIIILVLLSINTILIIILGYMGFNTSKYLDSINIGNTDINILQDAQIKCLQDSTEANCSTAEQIYNHNLCKQDRAYYEKECSRADELLRNQ